MVLVRGHDAISGVEIAEESTWGTASAGTYLRVPILSETLALERDQFPKAKEFGATGSTEFLEQGRSMVRGSITLHPRYDAKWFNVLLAHTFGTETLIDDEWLDGGSMTAAQGTTHGYIFGTALPVGLTIKVWKSGATAAGYWDIFTGCIISRMVVDQPEDDIARVTFDFVGSGVTTATASGAPATAGGSQFIKARDLSNTDSRVKTGATLAHAFSIRSLRLTMDRRIEAESAFLNAPDTLAKPGIIDTRDVTVELNGQLEQTYGAANSPWTEFLAKTASQCDIRWVSTEEITGSSSDHYGWRMHLPNMVWEEVNNNLGEPGANPFTSRGRGVLGTVASQAGTDEAASTVLATGASTDLRCFTVVEDGDDASGKFNDSSL